MSVYLHTLREGDTFYIYKYSFEFESRSWQGVPDTTICDKVCQWLATGQWFSLGTPVSSTNKTEHHDITEISLKKVINTITLTHILVQQRLNDQKQHTWADKAISTNPCWLTIMYNVNVNQL